MEVKVFPYKLVLFLKIAKRLTVAEGMIQLHNLIKMVFISLEICPFCYIINILNLYN